MEELALQQPKLIGRDGDLNTLKHSLDHATAGKGSTIFIAGEAGIGKTRLISELIKEAEKKGAQIIRGWCLAESLEPLMPVKTALREAGLFHLISGDPPPLVVSVYVMNDAGLLIAKSEREELSLDPYIFASMLKAVGSFVKDSMQMVDNIERVGGLNTLGYKDYKIIIEESNGLYMATVTKGSLSEMLIGDMKNMLAKVNINFGDVLKDWDGDLEKLEGIDNIVSELVKSGKYSGKYLVDDPKIRQENLFDNVLMGIQRLSNESPLILYLDDLQWADPTTLTLLHYLARSTKNNRVLLLGSYRPEDIVESWEGKTHQLTDTMQKMNREDLLTKIELERLDLQSTNQIIESMLGTKSLETVLLDRIYKETEGNPFFIQEVIKLLVEEKALTQDDKGAWKLTTDVEKLDIPSKVYDVIKRRLDKLMKEQRKVLDCASVVGEDFQSEVIGKVVRLDKLQLLENLSVIEKTHSLIHYLKDKYRFDHAKVREVLYNGIGEELRREYHRMVGDTIAEIHKEDTGKVVDELAHHYYEARDEKAVEYLIKLGENAWKDMSIEEATRAYMRANEMAREPRIKIKALIGLMDIHVYNDDLKLLGSEITEAMELLKVCKDKKLEARLLYHQGLLYKFQGFTDEATKLFEKRLQISIEINDKDGISSAYYGLAADAYTHGDYSYAIKCIENSLNIDNEQGDPYNKEAFSYRRMGLLTQVKGDYDRALEYYNKAILIAEKIGENRLITAIMDSMAEIADIRGEPEEIINIQEMNLKIFTEMGKKQDMDSIYLTRARIATLAENNNEAIEYYNKYKELSEANGNMIGLMHYNKMVSLIHFEKGEYDTALKYAEQSLKIANQLGDKFHIQSRRQNIAEIYFMMKYYNKALKCAEESCIIAKSLKAIRRVIMNYCTMTEIYLEMKNLDKALDNAKAGLASAIEIKAQLEEGICHRFLGMVHRERGDIEKALEEFEIATTMFSSMKVKKELACVQYERVLLFKIQGKTDEAKELLNITIPEFERMGMKLWADKCRKALEGL